MAKYRKKPVIIRAKQFTRENLNELQYFTNGELVNIKIPRCIYGIMIAEIETLEGTMDVTENDYIIEGIEGEFYPCKPDIFHKTYEKVGD